MNFSKTYRRMNEPVGPSPDLIRKTLSHPDRHRLPLRRLAAAAAVAAVLLATPALAVRSETGYAVLYRIAPAVAQFFQPIQEACTDSGITMEVAAVRVEDVAGLDELTVGTLGAKALGLGITAVLGGAAALLVGEELKTNTNHDTDHPF